MNMNKFLKFVSLLMCLCMLLGAAVAEEAAVAPEASAVIDIPADTVIATVNGETVTWGDVQKGYDNLVAQYGPYYDMTQQANIDLFRAVAMENRVVEVLLMQKAVEFGVSELSAEEIAQMEADAAAAWDGAISNYIMYFRPDITAESSEEDWAAATEEAVAYYNAQGYTPEILAEEYKYYAVVDKVQGIMVQDVVVTDADVDAYYQELVASDKELYENDIAAYMEYNGYVDEMEWYAAMYGTTSGMDYAWYKPEGFRSVKHILLPIDAELMGNYTDLQARYEEQQAGVAPAEGAEVVTEEMVNEARAAIFASQAETIDEINQKIADGVPFDELIATYGVNPDGTPSDPGMVNEPTMTTGYEVCIASGSVYVPEFVEAAMSIEEVGGVSAPYLSAYGIHIVKYVADVPGGPVEMTAEQRETKREQLLYDRQNELYNTTVEQWLDEADVQYTGVVMTVEELEAAQAADAAAEEPAQAEETAEGAAE